MLGFVEAGSKGGKRRMAYDLNWVKQNLGFEDKRFVATGLHQTTNRLD